MPKGYGYDKAPKKSSAFKMKGFSYAGDSPMKGKRKTAEKAVAAQAKNEALANITASMSQELKGSNILSGQSTKYGSPIEKKTPLRNDDDAEESFLSSDLGKGVVNYAGKKLADGIINAGINLFKKGKKNKQAKNKVNPAAAFSQMNITKS